MNRLQCELCGGTDIVKIGDDMFQCMHCGCKYTSSEAKKILFGEVVLRAQDFEIVGGRLVKYNGVGTEVVIPDSVTVIGKGAFAECSGITKVRIPESVYLIEDDAFVGCVSMSDVNLPGKLRTIGSGAFMDCRSLTKMVIPDSVTGEMLFTFFRCTALESVGLSKHTEVIGESAFENCIRLRSLYVPDGVRFIGHNAFADSGLEKIRLPYSLVSVDATAFGTEWDACSRLAHIEDNAGAYFREVVDPSWLPVREGHPIPAVERYVEQVADRRRAEKRCPYCGGRFKGVINRACENCGTYKDY